jgi:hypothetical protein
VNRISWISRDTLATKITRVFPPSPLRPCGRHQHGTRPFGSLAPSPTTTPHPRRRARARRCRLPAGRRCRPCWCPVAFPPYPSPTTAPRPPRFRRPPAGSTTAAGRAHGGRRVVLFGTGFWVGPRGRRQWLSSWCARRRLGDLVGSGGRGGSSPPPIPFLTSLRARLARRPACPRPHGMRRVRCGAVRCGGGGSGANATNPAGSKKESEHIGGRGRQQSTMRHCPRTNLFRRSDPLRSALPPPAAAITDARAPLPKHG